MDSIEIVLRKDNNNRDINLDSMSLGATQSLKEILESLIAIASYEKTISDIDLQIGVIKGSACPKLIGEHDHLRVVHNKIRDVVENKSSRDNVYVQHLNKIRDSIHEKKDFNIFYRSNDSKNDITNYFDNSFKRKREKERTINYFEIEFIKGKLMQNGGANPNFHLQIPSGIITIACTEAEAMKVNRFLYTDIYISAWVDKKKKGKREHNFCDLYASDNAKKNYSDFELFFKEISSLKGTGPLHKISEKLEYFYNNKDFNNAAKFLRLFNNKEVDPNYLKTIMIISKNIKNHAVNNTSFVESFSNLEELLNIKKIRK